MTTSKKQLKQYPWLSSYNEKIADHFGHNIEFDFLKHFKKLSNMGAELIIIDDCSIKIKIPTKRSWSEDGEWDEEVVNEAIVKSHQILIYILTNLPGTSQASIKKKSFHDELYLEWHF